MIVTGKLSPSIKTFDFADVEARVLSHVSNAPLNKVKATYGYPNPKHSPVGMLDLRVRLAGEPSEYAKRHISPGEFVLFQEDGEWFLGCWCTRDHEYDWMVAARLRLTASLLSGR